MITKREWLSLKQTIIVMCEKDRKKALWFILFLPSLIQARIGLICPDQWG